MPVSVMILLVVIVGIVALVFYNYSASYPGREENVVPVRASYPSGNPIYKVGTAYIIPIRFSKGVDKPIGVCRADINYLTPTRQVRSASIVFAVSPTSYRNTVSFSDGYVNLPVVVITEPSVDTQITVKFNSDGYQLNAITFYYCEYGVSNQPKWSETLMIPETVLSP